LGLRFTYTPTIQNGIPTLGANTFTGTQTAPAFVGDGFALTNVNANRLDGLDSTAFAGAMHTHNANQIVNAARVAGGNYFTGTQSITSGNLDLGWPGGDTGMITRNGFPFMHNAGRENTFLGEGAGSRESLNESNTGMGFLALSSTGFGSENAALGALALAQNTHGGYNSAVGSSALVVNTTGFGNSAIGAEALRSNTTGHSNTAVGSFSLTGNSTGSNNVAVGQGAGWSTTGSNNIYLGAQVVGGEGESNTMYLGQVGIQAKTVIAGVRGITTGVSDGIPVVIDSNGQLGTVSSSRRLKEDISDMPTALGDRLLQLRPVTFRYTKPFSDGSKPIQYGLVAEEVAEVFPELAVRNAEGEVETVHYETLNVLLLKQFQEQQKEIDQLKRLVGDLMEAQKRR
jgi:hypothetical protein